MRTAGNRPEGSLSPLSRREKVSVRVLPGSARAVLGLAGLLLVLALACGDSPSPTPTPTVAPTPRPTNTPAPTPTPVLSGVSPRSVLEVAAEAAETVESYHSELDLEVRSPTEAARLEFSYRLVVDYQEPDSWRAEITATVPLQGSIEVQMVSIGDTAYATNPETSEWEFVPTESFPLESIDLLTKDTVARMETSPSREWKSWTVLMSIALPGHCPREPWQPRPYWALSSKEERAISVSCTG